MNLALARDIVIIRVDLPSTHGASSGAGSAQTDAELALAAQGRQQFLDFLAPKAALLLASPPSRSGNVTAISLLGGNTSTDENHYLLLVACDLARTLDASAFGPPGATVSILGTYSEVQQWPS